MDGSTKYLYRNPLTGQTFWANPSDANDAATAEASSGVAALAVTGRPLAATAAGIREAACAAEANALEANGIKAAAEAKAGASVEAKPAVPEEADLAGAGRARKSPEQIQALKPQIEVLRTDRGRVDPAGLAQLMDKLPVLKSGSSADLKSFAAQTLGLPAGNIDIVSIKDLGTLGEKGVSGAPVYLIKNAEGRLMGAVKVFPPRQVFEMGSELSAMQTLREEKLQHLHSIDALAAAKLPDESGVLVLSPAKGAPIDDLMIEAGLAENGPKREAAIAKLREAVKQNGAALAELHTKPYGSGSKAAAALDNHAKALSEITEKIIDRVEGIRAKSGTLLVSPESLRQRAEALIEGLYRNPGTTSLIHGDFHPGNVFFDKEAGITVIDIGRLHESMNRDGFPIGSPARDFATFDQKLANLGAAYGLRDGEISELQSEFGQAYGVRGPSITDEANRFFHARAAAGKFLKFLNKSGDKIVSGDSDTSLEEMRDRQLKILHNTMGLR